jgi:DNA-binding transcriptional LysR family regulator
VRNLRSLDLNLLVALDALLSERHVTRAAMRIGLSQPAMSNALARLREIFDDDLLVRTPRGMEPTHRGLDLAEKTRQALRLIGHVFEEDIGFDPVRTSRRFRLRLSDLLEALALARLISNMTAAAPKAILDTVHLSPEATIEALELDTVDAAVSTGLALPGAIEEQPLFEDRLVCVMNASHPAANGRLTFEKFLSLRQVRVSISPTDSRFVDHVLSKMGRQRDVALTTPHWVVLPSILMQSDLVAVMAESLATMFAGTHDLVMRKVPFTVPPIVWTLYWHRRHSRSAPQLWFRQQVAAAFGNTERGSTPTGHGDIR